MSSYVNATTDLVTYGLNGVSVVNISPTILQAQCDAASTLADGYLFPRMPVPVGKQAGGAYPVDLVMRVAHIAAYNIICTRGFNPESGGDMALQQRYKMAVEWLEDVQRQRITPPWVVEPTSANYQMPNVVSGAPRGW